MIDPRDEVLAVNSAEHGGRFAFMRDDGSRSDTLHDFSVCLNAYGAAPLVIEAVKAAPIDEYPDPRCIRARRVVSAQWRVSMPSIVIGAGSAELIQAVCFAYVRPGDDVIVVEPAFGEYRRAAALCGARVTGISLTGEHDVAPAALAEIRQRRPRVVFLASPVNPSGVVVGRETLRALADACTDADTLLVLDQAYDAFSEAPIGTPALVDHPNVLHLRSLTKEHALAGVRVAVGVGPSHVIKSVEGVRVPWATSAAAQAALIATFTDSGQAHARATITQLRAERARIADAVTAVGGEVSPSTTHYVLIRCPDATRLRNQLATGHGILVRDCTSFGLRHHIRVAARLPHENDRLINALRQTLS